MSANETINVSGKVQHQIGGNQRGGNPGDLVIDKRLERIEDVLGRIDIKLDGKASKEDLRRLAETKAEQTDVMRIEARISDIERGETPSGKMFLDRYHRMEQSVDDIVRHGSGQAQELAIELKRLEGMVDTLREDSIRMSGVSQERVNDVASRVRFWTMAISAMNVALIMINVVVSVIVGLHL